MGVISCTPWVESHRSRSERSGSTAILYYSVVCDPGTLPPEAETATPYGIGVPMESDPLGRVCSAIEAIVEPGSNIIYRVGVEFNNALGEIVTDPLARVFRPSIDFEESREPYSVDEVGNAVVTSAGTSFDPPPEIVVADPVVTLIYNVEACRALLMADMMFAVNDDVFLGADPGEFKVVGATSNPLTENGTEFYQETWRLKLRRNSQPYRCAQEGWADLFLDEARYQTTADLSSTDLNASILTPISDQDGDQVVDPVALNGAGAVLNATNGPDPGKDFVASTDGKSVFRVRNPLKRRAFVSIFPKPGKFVAFQ